MSDQGTEKDPSSAAPAAVASKAGKAGAKGEAAGGGVKLALAAIGLEAELDLWVDDRHVKPETLFGSPRDFVRGVLMHRKGSSYHLPTGAAAYFDTGVIEVATPVIEIAPGCGARAGRSLWESILAVRDGLDDWDARTGHHSRLVGFSTHYNVSFELDREARGARRTVRKLALLLSYILPAPVMLLATNRQSEGVGVRPRGDRIEVTADFTPSPALMIATATLVTGIVRQVMTWPSYELSALANYGLPIFADFEPMPHRSRKGWLAHADCYPANPFTSDLDAEIWPVQRGRREPEGGAERMALRQIAIAVFAYFRRGIRQLSDPFTYRLIESVLSGHSPSLLDLDERPAAYEDVGRLCVWDNLFPESVLPRSRYERVLIRAIRGKKLRMGRHVYRPTGMDGWSAVVFRRESDDSRHVFSFDELLGHLEDWERGG